jgi:hypothetical protein
MKDAVHTESTMVYPSISGIRRVCWGAIFAGVFVAVALQLMLTFLGAAIGASAMNPFQQQSPFEGKALFSLIWLAVTIVISTWCGAFMAGRLSGGPRCADGLLHGIVTWSVSTAVAVVLLATAGGYIFGGNGMLISDALTNARQGQSHQNGDSAVVQSQNRRDSNLSPTGRDQNAASQPGASHSRQISESMTSAASTTAWAGFGALALGLIISAWGGWSGTSSLFGYTDSAVPASP